MKFIIAILIIFDLWLANSFFIHEAEINDLRKRVETNEKKYNIVKDKKGMIQKWQITKR